MHKQLVIFDLDGTLLDTLDDLADAVNWALEQEQLPRRTREEVRAFVGNGIRNLIERAVPTGTEAAQTDRVFAGFKARYAGHCADKTRPYPGILELLARLRAEGIRTAVVSNKADFAVQTLCRDYFPGLVDCAVGERAGIPKKPAPDSVQEVLRALEIPREQAVYVGDSDVDVLTARNAGMDGILVLWGFRDRQTLERAGAKTFAATAEELCAALIG